jgi:hypothetical protein
MSLSEILIKVVGCILVLVGLALVLAGVGVNFLGVSATMPPILEIVIGALFIGAGIFVIRGGSITA